MSTQNKKSAMTLYSSDNNLFCDRIKMILAEKDIIVPMINISTSHKEFIFNKNEINLQIPTLITKEFIINNHQIIFEYLEERFPYPPLLSVFPIERALTRMLSNKIDEEWIPLIHKILNTKEKENFKKHKISLLKMLYDLIPIFKERSYLQAIVLQ